jgi:hypothetical protein
MPKYALAFGGRRHFRLSKKKTGIFLNFFSQETI